MITYHVFVLCIRSASGIEVETFLQFDIQNVSATVHIKVSFRED